MQLLSLFLFRICLFICLVSSSIYAVSYVHMMDPAPVQLSQEMKLSVVSKEQLDSVSLVIGDSRYLFQKDSAHIFQLTLTVDMPLLDATLKGIDTALVLRPIKGKAFRQDIQFDIRDGNDLGYSFVASFDSQKKTSKDLDKQRSKVGRLERKLIKAAAKQQSLKHDLLTLEETINSQQSQEVSARKIKLLTKKYDSMRKKYLLHAKKHASLISDSISEITAFNRIQKKYQKKFRILKEIGDEITFQAGSSGRLEFDPNESILELLRTDISLKNKELYLEQEKLIEEEAGLLEKKQGILHQKAVIEQDKAELSKLSVLISEQRTQVLAATEALDEVRSGLKLERKKRYENPDDKKGALAKGEALVAAAKKSLQEKTVKLDYLLQEEQAKKEDLRLDYLSINDQVSHYESERDMFYKKKEFIKDIEMELSIKYDIMHNIGLYIDKQLDTLKKENNLTKEKQLSYEKSVDNRLDYVNNLTNLIERRARRLERLNSNLAVKNRHLSEMVEQLTYPSYQYSVAPSIGFRYLADTSDISDIREYGFTVSSFIDIRKSFFLGFSRVNFVQTMDDNRTELKYRNYYNGGLVFLLNSSDRARIYLKGGLERDITQNTVTPLTGLSFRYFFKKNVVSKFDFLISDDTLFNVGFERHFFPVTSDDSDKEGPRKKLSGAKNEVSVDLRPIDSRFQFTPKTLDISDNKKRSWYKKAVSNVTTLGLFDVDYSEKGAFYNPKRAVSFEDAVDALLWTYYIEDLLQPQSTDITFSVLGLAEGNPLKMSVSVFDAKGKKIHTLVEKKNYYPGTYTIQWDGHMGEGSINPGAYKIVVEAYAMGLDLKNTSQKTYKVSEQLVAYEEREFYVQNVTSLLDHPRYRNEFSRSTQKPLLKKALDMRLLPDSIRIDSGTETLAMTRFDMMVAVSRLLVLMGAELPSISVDYSPYSDWNEIPVYQRNLLATYLIELGYGGDDNSKLNPYQLITKAEAAVIMNRVLNWKQRYLSIKNISVNLTD